MTDPRDAARRARPADDAGREALEREARHAVLADLLGPYADGELPAESAAQVDAHLVGCARCRRDLAVQAALRDRLAAESVRPAPPALRERVVAIAAAVPAPRFPAPAAAPAAAPARAGRRWRAAAAAVVAAGAVAAGGVWAVRGGSDADAPPRPAPVTAAPVPLVAAALLDYRRVTAGDLPGRARDLEAVRAAVGFPVEPLHAPGLRLLAAWTTALDGEACAVLAYRRGDRLVLHYLVPEASFFRYSALRAAAAARRPLAVRDGAQGVLAWPEAASGAFLIADEPPARLAALLPALTSAAPAPAPAERR